MDDTPLFVQRATGEITVDTTRTSLNGFGVFAIVVFACVSLIVIHPLKLRIPKRLAQALRRGSRRLWLVLAGPPDASEQQDQDAVEREVGSAPCSDEPMYLTIDHVSAPVIGVLVLLATTTIGGEQVKQGIVGEDGIEPYDVLALFISLAYIAISLDATGLLRYLAFLICLKAGRQGREAKGKTLFLLLYFFFWSAGVLVGNDPVILSGTAFLVYFTRVAGISPPDAWIWAEFVAANISSAVLVSSNPTNLVIATGFDVNFITYTAYMVLPAFGSAVGGLISMLVFFRNREGGKEEKEDRSYLRKFINKAPVIGDRLKVDRSESQIRHRSNAPTDSTNPNAEPPSTAPNHASHMNNGTTPVSDTASTAPMATWSSKDKKRSPLIYIPETIIRPDVDPRAALVDKVGAIFGSVVMAATLATLVGTSVVGGVKVFEIAVPGAVLCFVRDGMADWLRWRALRLEKEKPEEEPSERAVETDGSTRAQQDLERKSKAKEQASKAAAMEVEEIELATLSASRPDIGPDKSSGSADHTSPTPPTNVAASSSGFSASPSPSSSSPADAAPRQSRNLLRRAIRVHRHLTSVFPTVSIVLSRLPIPLLPFAFSMFILVQALAHVGFINILAAGLGHVCSAGYIATAFFISFLGIILCNIGGTNIGATILLTKSVRSPYFSAKIQSLTKPEQELVLKVAQYSIAFGSNVGALGGTFAASLAGLLWLAGLRQGGITVKARQFLTWCAVVIVPSTAIGIAIIVAEVRYFHVTA